MKRYILFKGDNYCPIGGWNDFAGFFDSIEEAKAILPSREYEGADWWHIVDSKTMTVVEKGGF